MSLRVLLVLLILVAALPVFAMQVIHRAGEREAEAEQISASALRLAELEAEAVARLVDKARVALTTMAQFPSVLAGDGEACSDRIRELRSRLPEFAGIAALTVEGETFCRSTPGGGTISIGDRPYFQEVVRERRFAGSGYLVGRALQQPSMVFAAPALDAAGELRAVVLVSYTLDILPELLSTADLPEGATVTLVDSRGNQLARLPALAAAHEAPRPAFLQGLDRSVKSTTTAVGLDGVERVYGYVPLPEPARMGIAVGLPLSPALAQIDAQMWRDLAIFAAIFGLAALGALAIGEFGIRRPLDELKSTARRLAGGDLAARARIRRGAAGEVGALASSLNDMADAIAQRETALAASEAFKERMIASSRDCIKILDLDGRLISMNDHGREMLGVESADQLVGLRYVEMWSADMRDEVSEAVARARAGQAARFQGIHRTARGHERWWDVSATPIMDARQRPECLLVVSRDMTELKEAEKQRETLLAELDHRVKNTLAVVQSLARRTLGAGPEARAFTGRIDALATAHALLSRTSWEGSSLRDLLTRILQPYAGRIGFQGPNVHLEASATQAMAMIVHELASNAAKHGPLSSGDGRVDIRWTLHQDGIRELRLEWSEHGGPRVRPPDATGFGLDFLRRTLEHELGGTAEINYPEEGLRCRLVLPLPEPRFRQSEEAPRQDQPTSPHPTTKVSIADRSILVLEDAGLIAMELQSVIEAANCTVIGPAATCAEAMRLIGSRPIDAAVLDVNLQGETSFAVAEALRDRSIPFVFVTGYGDRYQFPPEFADVPRVQKPFRDDELLAALASVLDDPPGRAEEMHADREPLPTTRLH